MPYGKHPGFCSIHTYACGFTHPHKHSTKTRCVCVCVLFSTDRIIRMPFCTHTHTSLVVAERGGQGGRGEVHNLSCVLACILSATHGSHVAARGVRSLSVRGILACGGVTGVLLAHISLIINYTRDTHLQAAVCALHRVRFTTKHSTHTHTHSHTSPHSRPCVLARLLLLLLAGSVWLLLLVVLLLHTLYSHSHVHTNTHTHTHAHARAHAISTRRRLLDM